MSLLRITGEVNWSRDLTFDELSKLPGQVPDVGTLVNGKQGGAVRLRSILDAARACGSFLTLMSTDGFSISVPLGPIEDALVTYRLGHGPLPEKHGGPVRFLIPAAAAASHAEIDECANVKSLREIHVTLEKEPDNHSH